jgi:hypothetical protein
LTRDKELPGRANDCLRQPLERTIMSLIKTVFVYLLARLGESSTWSSLIAWASAEIGIRTNADFNKALVHVGLALVALAGVLIKEGWQIKVGSK